jgi:transposase
MKRGRKPKLTEEQEREIYRIWRNRPVRKRMAAEYGVSDRTITRIINQWNARKDKP